MTLLGALYAVLAVAVAAVVWMLVSDIHAARADARAAEARLAARIRADLK